VLWSASLSGVKRRKGIIITVRAVQSITAPARKLALKIILRLISCRVINRYALTAKLVITMMHIDVMTILKIVFKNFRKYYRFLCFPESYSKYIFQRMWWPAGFGEKPLSSGRLAFSSSPVLRNIHGASSRIMVWASKYICSRIAGSVSCRPRSSRVSSPEFE